MIVIKIGGSLRSADGLLEEVARSQEQVVLLHGASRELNELSERLGHPPRMVTSERGEVSRFTDSVTMDHFLMAYAGKVNKRIVERLRAHGADAVGLSALDGGIAVGRRRSAIRVREGDRVKVLHDDHAGSIERIEPRLLRLLLENGFLPVLTPPAADHAGTAINVDGDRLAMEIASSLQASRLLIFGDTAGLLRDPADDATLIPRLRASAVEDALQYARGRARVKLRAARGALERGVSAVALADGRGPSPLRDALAGAGTWITA